MFGDRLRVDAVEARVHLPANLAHLGACIGQQVAQVAAARAVHRIHRHAQLPRPIASKSTRCVKMLAVGRKRIEPDDQVAVQRLFDIHARRFRARRQIGRQRVPRRVFVSALVALPP